MKGNQGKHDSLIDYIEQELTRRGITNTHRNTKYNKGICGEIDLYATKNNYILLFEMKSNNTYKAQKKAIEQLNRAQKYYFKNQRVFKFYVSNHAEPRIQWIK